jgi:hypothetical protein
VKPLGAVGLAILFGACSFAQYRTFGHVGTQSTYGSNTGFGRVIFPGTGHPPGLGAGSSMSNTFGSNTGCGRVIFPGTGHPPAVRNPLSITDPTFAARLGATVGGFGTRFDWRGYRRFRQPLVVPYAVPVYVGGYPDYGYADQQGQQDMMPPPQAPQVIINQNFIPERAEPVTREYGEDSSGLHVYEAPGREPVETAEEDNINYYLIAFKDHSIYSAFAYWVEGDTLHYVTPQRAHNQVSISLVDRELTDKLNRDRKLQVKLPR